jgi:hypothetical protein
VGWRRLRAELLELQQHFHGLYRILSVDRASPSAQALHEQLPQVALWVCRHSYLCEARLGSRAEPQLVARCVHKVGSGKGAIGMGAEPLVGSSGRDSDGSVSRQGLRRSMMACVRAGCDESELVWDTQVDTLPAMVHRCPPATPPARA